MSKIKYPNRLEIRISSEVSKKLDAYCELIEKKHSEVLREAVEIFLITNNFKTTLLTLIDTQEDFRNTLREFIAQSPSQVSKFFDELIGSEEEHRVKNFPIIKGLEDFFVTDKGRKAFNRKKNVCRK